MKELLVDRGMTNGLRGRAFNGTGDLAVRVIAGLKIVNFERSKESKTILATAFPAVKEPAAIEAYDDSGNFYLYPAGTRNAGEEYTYTVSIKEGEIHLKAQAGYSKKKTFFDGKVEDFNSAVEAYDDENSEDDE